MIVACVDFEVFFVDVIMMMTESLKRARQALPYFFHSATWFISVTDNDNAEAIENDTACLLNNDANKKAFLARYA